MKKKFLVAVLAITLVCAMAGAGTMAWFADSATSSGNDFTAGELIVGGTDDVTNADHYFATITFDGLQPGETRNIPTTTLKNRGDLPFYLYRLTAANIEDATGLDEVLNIVVTIGDERVYTGKVSQLQEDNGGYFDPVYGIDPDEEIEMEIEVTMDTAAGNAYQGQSMTCDFTIYASQDEQPIQGEPTGDWFDLGSTSAFSVEGRNILGWTSFDWDWTPNDTDYEHYEIMIKHETGDPNAEIDEERWQTEEPFLWWTVTVDHFDEDIEVYDMLTGEVIDLDTWDVLWNAGEDIVSIDQDAFPSDWEGFEFKLSGTQEEGGTMQSLPIQYWSFDK